MKVGLAKCYVVYDEEYPGGMIFEDRYDALAYSREIRDSGNKAYTRVNYYTKKELAALQEAD